MGRITILRAGPATTVQDLGRLQHRHEGIATGGALDLHAARVANLLVGNTEERALLEIAFGPVRLRFEDERIIAFCGASNGMPLGKPVRVQPNEEIELSAPEQGCRSWLAIAGGIEVPLVLGSRATDLRGHFGGHEGRALRDGDELALGETLGVPKFSGRMSDWSAPNEWSQTARPRPILRVTRGSEWEDFAADAQTAFLQSSYLVTQKADRMGARLKGSRLARVKETELISEAVAPGTIQVSNDQQPILLLGDCQTIGGYPKIAHVITVDLPLAAQLRPHDDVRFQVVTLEEAQTLFLARAADLERFRIGLRLRSP